MDKVNKPVVVLFDFDGTLTTSDTLPLFIKYMTGCSGLLLSMLKTLPAMILLACNGWRNVGKINAGRTKEKLLASCFAHQSCEQITRRVNGFVDVIEKILAPNVMERLYYHINQGDKVVIVSASVDVWISPWAHKYGISDIIATRLETAGSTYTGRFYGNNCNGAEKVKRIAELYKRDNYHIIAYGNSSGDYPMLDYAHESYLCKNGSIENYK